MTRWPAVLLAVPLIGGLAFGLAGCGLKTFSVHDVTTDLTKLAGVATAEGQTLTGNPDRPDTLSFYVTLKPTATVKQVAAITTRWQDDAQSTHRANVELIVSTGSVPLSTLSLESDANADAVTATKDWFAVARGHAIATTVAATTVDHVVRDTGGDLATLATDVRETVGGSVPGRWRLTASGVSVHAGSGIPDAASLALAASVASAVAPDIAVAARTIDVASGAHPTVAVDLSSTSAATAPAKRELAAFDAMLRAVPITSGARVELTISSREVATLDARACTIDGPQAAALWATWGGPAYCS